VDLYRTIRDLLEERKKLDVMIARLERLRDVQSERPLAKRRGRKTMTEDQRREVSERMKRYWEQKRHTAT
jgi:hypothetical protein